MQELNEVELASVTGGVAVANTALNFFPVVAVSDQSSRITNSIVVLSAVDNNNTAIQNSNIIS